MSICLLGLSYQSVHWLPLFPMFPSFVWLLWSCNTEFQWMILVDCILFGCRLHWSLWNQLCVEGMKGLVLDHAQNFMWTGIQMFMILSVAQCHTPWDKISSCLSFCHVTATRNTSAIRTKASPTHSHLERSRDPLLRLRSVLEVQMLGGFSIKSGIQQTMLCVAGWFFMIGSSFCYLVCILPVSSFH
jgi:hypothetical protein